MRIEQSFELSIYRNREGKWVAVARTGEPGKERTVGKPLELSADDLWALIDVAEASLSA